MFRLHSVANRDSSPSSASVQFTSIIGSGLELLQPLSGYRRAKRSPKRTVVRLIFKGFKKAAHPALFTQGWEERWEGEGAGIVNVLKDTTTMCEESSVSDLSQMISTTKYKTLPLNW